MPDNLTKSSIRDGFGIERDATVALIIYESECEFEFLSLLPQLASSYNRLIVYPYSPNARRQLSRTCAPIFREANVMVLDDLGLAEQASDVAVLFRYNEALIHRNIPIRLLDVRNRWMSQEMCLGMEAGNRKAQRL